MRAEEPIKDERSVLRGSCELIANDDHCSLLYRIVNPPKGSPSGFPPAIIVPKPVQRAIIVESLRTRNCRWLRAVQSPLQSTVGVFTSPYVNIRAWCCTVKIRKRSKG